MKKLNLDYFITFLHERDKLFALKDKYRQGVQIHDPGYIGSVMITSEMPELTSEDMAREFDIESLDDYFLRSQLHRNNVLKSIE